MQDLQESQGLEDLQGHTGALVQAGDALPGGQVRDHLVEEVAPACRLYGVVGHKVRFAHVGPSNVRRALERDV